MWALLLIPLTLAAIRFCSALQLRLLGIILTTAGIMALAVVAGREALTWLPGVSAEERWYLGHRVAFVLFAVLTDLPIVQVTSAGLVCWLSGRRSTHAAERRRFLEDPSGAGELS
jgi:hypothetical protein